MSKKAIILLVLNLFISLVYSQEYNLSQTRVITDSLKDNECIIEFITELYSGETIYSARIFKNGMSMPQLYKVCREQDLINMLDDDCDFYTDKAVLSTVLSPMLAELEDICTVYYIPSGKLHEIALEYLVDSNGKMFCENYDVYRLSSFFVSKGYYRRKNSKRISIWGGIDYYAELPELSEYKYSDTSNVFKCNLGYLEESYKAAATINDEVQQRGNYSEMYSDNTATEERFKSYDWNNFDVFLIETHGLFLNDYRLFNINDRSQSMENHALALSGASFVLEGGLVPNNIDDGLLTAKEISDLKLSNVDLAIVSACNSALGDIKNGNIYGLMQGFKKAGVKSLIMALDNIVDYVSGQLWIQFFRNLDKGKTKREALLEGLKYIRTMDNGFFSHPKYWTPYILIDGLD